MLQIDPDINNLLTDIEKGHHSLDNAVDIFLVSLPGFRDRLHSPSTVRKYEACLRKGPNCLLAFLKFRNKKFVEEISKEDLEIYKAFLLNQLDPQTVKSFITACRLLLNYMFRLGWLDQDMSIGMLLPKTKRKEHIKTVPKEVAEEVLRNSWGTNSFAVARNNLITHLFLKRGLHPKEFPSLMETDIHPYEDLAYLTVIGKRGVPRDVMLDPETLQMLRIYMLERAHHMLAKRIRSANIFLSLNPHDDSYAITVSGVQAVIRRIKQEMKLKGCLWDLSALNPQGCRRTAVSDDYEKAEDSPVHHPEFTLCGQYGHSLAVAQKYYWKKSLKNAYRFVKNKFGPIGPQESSVSNNKDHTSIPESELRKLFPDSTFFRDFGVNI